MLLHGTRADVELTRDFFIAAALHQQLQYLLIARRNLHVIEINHCVAICSFGLATLQLYLRSHHFYCTAFAKYSLPRLPATPIRKLHLQASACVLQPHPLYYCGKIGPGMDLLKQCFISGCLLFLHRMTNAHVSTSVAASGELATAQLRLQYVCGS